MSINLVHTFILNTRIYIRCRIGNIPNSLLWWCQCLIMCHTTALSLACPLYKHRGLPTEDRPEKLHNVEPVVYLRLNIQRYRSRTA